MFKPPRLRPRQLRNLRHWGMELVVVVVGVLLALWAQEWVEGRRAVDDMRAAEEAIHQEVRTALTALMSKEAMSKCHLERAELLKAMLLSGSSDWPGIDENPLAENMDMQTVVPSLYMRSWTPFATSAWDSALTTGALAPMDRDRFSALVRVYDHIDAMKRNEDREDRGATTLSALALPQELSPETRSRMLQALYEVDASRYYFATAGTSELSELMVGVGWDDKMEMDRWIASVEAELRSGNTIWRPCFQTHRNPFDTAR